MNTALHTPKFPFFRWVAFTIVVAFACVVLGLTNIAITNAADETTSDSEAFAQYYAEFDAYNSELLQTYIQYLVAPSAEEKSAAALQFEDEVVIAIEDFGALEVRECYAPLAEMANELFEQLARYFQYIDTNPPYADAILAYAGSLSTGISGQVNDTVIACAGG